MRLSNLDLIAATVDQAGRPLRVGSRGASSGRRGGDGTAAATPTTTAETVDFLRGAVHGVGVIRIDEHLAGVVLGNVDLRTGRFRDAADRFAAGPDEQADLPGIDLDRLDAALCLRAERGQAPCGDKDIHHLDRKGEVVTPFSWPLCVTHHSGSYHPPHKFDALAFRIGRCQRRKH